MQYVSYTTQSLAKTSKMIPVLVVGALVWKKQHRQREWVAGGVILIGSVSFGVGVEWLLSPTILTSTSIRATRCATYLFSQPPRVPSHGALVASAADDGKSMWDGLMGTCFLLGYLFFDGLVSTTQERVFGKNPSSNDPFGPESPVLDQMVSWARTSICDKVLT